MSDRPCFWLPHPRMVIGTDWTRSLTWRDSAGTLVTAATSYDGADMTLRDQADVVLLELSTTVDAEKGLITLADTAPNITLYVPESLTSTLEPAWAEFDFRLILDGNPLEPLFEGSRKNGSALEIHRGMTRA